MDKTVKIICSLVEDLDKPSTKSRKGLCNECFKPIWVAITTDKCFEKTHKVFSCMNCLKESDDEYLGLLPMQQEQQEELLENGFTEQEIKRIKKELGI